MCFERIVRYKKGSHVTDKKRSFSRASGWQPLSRRRSGWCDPVVRRATQPSTCAALQWLPPIGRALLIAVIISLVAASTEGAGTGRIAFDDLVEIVAQHQYEAVRPESRSAIALHFKVKDTWHFYADAKTAPGEMNLTVQAQADGLVFDEPVFGESHSYFDKSSERQVQAFSGEFTVYVPFAVEPGTSGQVDIAVSFDGAVCSESLCQRPPFDKLLTRVVVAADAAMDAPAFELPQRVEPKIAAEARPIATVVALALALLAGLVLNLMPCVWPVIPIIVMRLVEQAKQSRARSVALGSAFCGGIMLFFVTLALANIILQVGFDTVFQWGDHFRNPAVLIAMVLLLVVLAMFMFGTFTIGIPASLAGKASGAKGIAGSIGMGFLAAILATPCSFAILTVAFAWAQTQPLVLSTVAILLIGAGMACPYVVLTSLPGLLRSIPKPGRWMEMIKQAIGFILLIIAIKMLAALPQARAVAVLYCAVGFAVAVWIWGTWVSFSTPALRKRIVRTVAVVIAVLAALWLLGEKKELIDWQEYDAQRVAQARLEGQPVLLEFMAEWCLSCKTVEKIVYSRKDVAELIEQKGVLAVRADTTLRDYPATIDLWDVYREPAVPVTILLPPDNPEPVRLRGVLIRKDLTKELTKLANNKDAKSE